MFKLSLHDHHGNELKLGDIVRVNTGNSYPSHFYARVTWIKDKQIIAPFSTFSFHSFERVDDLPEGAIKSTEDSYDIWYLPDNDEETSPEIFKDYLMSWRDLEYNLNSRCYRITPDTQLGLF